MCALWWTGHQFSLCFCPSPSDYWDRFQSPPVHLIGNNTCSFSTFSHLNVCIYVLYVIHHWLHPVRAELEMEKRYNHIFVTGKPD